MRRSLLIVVVLCAIGLPAQAAAPDNDFPATAVQIDSFPADIEAATAEATTGQYEQTCGVYASGIVTVAPPVKAVWYVLNLPPAVRQIKVHHDDDAELVLWNRIGTSPTDTPILSRWGCVYDDDYPTDVPSGETYMSVGSALDEDVAPYSLKIEIVEPEETSAIQNDVPYRAAKIASLPYTVEQDTSGAYQDYDERGCPNGPFVWYTYTPPASQSVEISVTSEASYVGATVAAYSLGSEVQTLGCDYAESEPAVVDATIAGGVPVLIGIGDEGRLSLSVREIASETPDDRANASILSNGATIRFDTSTATLEHGEPRSCGSGGSLWYTLPARPRAVKVVATGGVSIAAVEGDSVLACDSSGTLTIPADSHATHVQIRAPAASGTVSLGFAPAFGRQITDASPFEAGCGDQSGTPQQDSEVEISQSVDPHDPGHVLVTWQQDRNQTQGGSQGIGAAVSFDGGNTWTRTTIPGITRCSGGAFARGTDPWAAIDADGTAYVMSLGYDPSPVDAEDLLNLRNTVLINRSEDGGLTWSEPIVVAESPGVLFNDKETLTADPNTPGLLYAVWDLYPTNEVVPVFSRSEDGGRTWTPPVPLPNDGAGDGDQIAVLNDGTIVDIAARGSMQSITSHDRGVTWSRPTAFADASSTEGPPGVRGGAGIPSVATDGRSIFVSWSDTYMTYFARSDDEGTQWAVSRPGVSFDYPSRSTTAVAATRGGRVAVMTYLVDPLNQTRLVLASSIDGGVTWSEQPITDSFDLTRAPISEGRGYFVGDYFGLSASGDEVIAAFAAVPPGEESEVSNVYSLRVLPS